MLSLKLSPEAIKDLEKIYEHTLKSWGSIKAENYQDDLFERMLLMTNNSQIGAIYYFKHGNYRKLIADRHILFYQQSSSEISIIRILPEKMDLANNFE